MRSTEELSGEASCRQPTFNRDEASHALEVLAAGGVVQSMVIRPPVSQNTADARSGRWRGAVVRNHRPGFFFLPG